MKVTTLAVGLLQTNCYIVADEETTESAIIDPGGHAHRILDVTAELSVKYVINTHAHFDHTADNGKVLDALRDRQETAPQLVCHPEAAPVLASDGGAAWFGLPPVRSPKPDVLVEDGDELHLGPLVLQVLHTPGHSPGSISLYIADRQALFAGDTLFRRGVGRFDLPGGDWDVLQHAILDQLFALPDESVVYPGHGPTTTIGEERKHNPYVG
jgi:glyoxylase-like metal-dependent hydrolase (beta-lactamase superfamily II)